MKNRVNEEMIMDLLRLPAQDILELLSTVGVASLVLEASQSDRIEIACSFLGFAHKMLILGGCKIDSVITTSEGTVIKYTDGKQNN